MISRDVAQASRVSRADTFSTADRVAFSVAVMGGLNWGLIGVFSFDPVATLLGDHSMPARVAYLLFGLSSIYATYTATKLVQPL
jgi:uncharacterized membrane protein YuzA (DUF378 family)